MDRWSSIHKNMIQSGSSDSFLISYRMNRLNSGISGKKRNKLSAKSDSMPEKCESKLLISESEFSKFPSPNSHKKVYVFSNSGSTQPKTFFFQKSVKINRNWRFILVFSTMYVFFEI